MFKRITSALLALALVCSFALPVMAAKSATSADTLAQVLSGGREPEYNKKVKVEGEKVILLDNIELTEEVTFSTGNVTLDLGTFNITGTTKARIFEITNGSLTIEGSGTISTAISDPNTAAFKVSGNGTLTVNSGNISTVDTAIWASSNGTVNINGGRVSSSGEIAVSTNGNDTNPQINIKGGTVQASSGYPAVYVPSGKLTVEGSANVTGGAGIVARKNGEVEVKGGTITGTNPDSEIEAGDGENNKVKGGAIVANESGAGKVTVDGENVTVNGTVEAVKGLNPDEGGDKYIDVKKGTFTNPGENFDKYVDSNAEAEAKVGDTYTVGTTENVKQAVKNAQPGQTVTVEKAPEGTDFQVDPGVVVENKMSSDSIKVNGSEVEHGESITIPMPATPAGSAPAETPKPGEFIVCEACGHHNWEPYLEGWRCTNCGHLRGTTGVPAAAAKSASTAPKSPQTGLWWLLG